MTKSKHKFKICSYMGGVEPDRIVVSTMKMYIQLLFNLHSKVEVECEDEVQCNLKAETYSSTAVEHELKAGT